MKQTILKTFEFDFEAIRTLWYAPVGGADFGEVRSILPHIREHDYESWFTAWNNLSDKVAKTAGDDISRGQALLRANRYYCAVEFFLDPDDPRKLTAYENSKTVFYEALELLQIPYESREIVCEKTKLRTLHFCGVGETKNQTIVACGGFDATLEELYFTIVVPAIQRGYDVILYEGPGQSDVVRYQKIPFTTEWDVVAKSVIDAYGGRETLGKITGLGLSLGGHLVARAAGQNPNLFDSIILFNYFPSVLESQKVSIPSIMHGMVDRAHFPAPIRQIAEKYIRSKKFMNWQFHQAEWTFGASGLNDLLVVAQPFNEENWPEKITANVLMFVAEHDNYYNPARANDFANRLTAAKSVENRMFTANDGGDLHCENGAYYLTSDAIFDWLAKTN